MLNTTTHISKDSFHYPDPSPHILFLVTSLLPSSFIIWRLYLTHWISLSLHSMFWNTTPPPPLWFNFSKLILYKTILIWVFLIAWYLLLIPNYTQSTISILKRPPRMSIMCEVWCYWFSFQTIAYHIELIKVPPTLSNHLITPRKQTHQKILSLNSPTMIFIILNLYPRFQSKFVVNIMTNKNIFFNWIPPYYCYP